MYILQFRMYNILNHLIKCTKESLENANKEILYLSQRDSLTGCYNRRAFFDLLEELFIQSVKTNTDLAGIMVDIDHFKDLNDTYGHQAGDDQVFHVSSPVECMSCPPRQALQAERPGYWRFLFRGCPGEPPAMARADGTPFQRAGDLSHQHAKRPITNGRMRARALSSIWLLRRQTQTRRPSLSSREVLMLFFNMVSGPFGQWRDCIILVIANILILTFKILNYVL